MDTLELLEVVGRVESETDSFCLEGERGGLRGSEQVLRTST